MSEITGELIVKGESKEYGTSGFRKREFVIKTDSKFPQEIPMELIQDKCDLLNQYDIGDILKLSYNLNGRSWVNPEGVTKYFGSTQVWRIESLQESQSHDSNMPAPDLSSNEPDDLPF